LGLALGDSPHKALNETTPPWATPVDSDRLSRLLAERGSALSEIADSAMAAGTVSDLQFALRCLVRRAGLELTRLSVAPTDTEQAALAVRNCFETNLIVRYVIESRENLMNWFSLRAQEQIDILSNVLKIHVVDPDALELEKQGLEREIERLRLVLQKHGMPKAKSLPKWASLADRYGLKNIYESYYSLFSKYLHPSTLNVFPQNDEFKRMLAAMFLARAQLYAVDLTVRSLEALGLDESILSRSTWSKA
jgi:hypothetical protein